MIIIAGAVEDRKILSDSGIDFLFSIAPGPITLEESKSRASRLIQETVEAVVWLVKTFNGRKSS